MRRVIVVFPEPVPPQMPIISGLLFRRSVLPYASRRLVPLAAARLHNRHGRLFDPSRKFRCASLMHSPDKSLKSSSLGQVGRLVWRIPVHIPPS